MKLSIEKTDRTRNSWGEPIPASYQLFLHTAEIKIEVGPPRPAYSDCLNQADQVIVEFSKEKVLLVSNEIYDLHP